MHCSGAIWNLTVGTGGFLPGAGKMQNRAGAIGDMERRKDELRAGIVHVMVGHGFLWTHFQVVSGG